MKKKETLQDELNEHAPFLEPFKQRADGFQVPEAYFDTFEDDLFRRIEASGARRQPFGAPPKPGLVRTLWQPRMAMAIAASLTLALAAWWYFRPAPADAFNPDIAVANLSAEDAEAYLLANLHDMDPEQIALVLPAEDWQTQAPDSGEDAPETTPKNLKKDPEIAPNDLEHLLNDMSDEELEKLL